MNRVEKEAFDAIERGDNIKIAAHLKPVLFGLFKGLNPNSSRDDGFSLLMEAASKGNLEICKLLVEKGAGIDYATEEGFTALMAAAWHGKLDVAKYLIDQGANVNAVKTDEGLKWSPLVFASRYGQTEAVRLLLEKGADPSVRNVDGKEIFILAKEQGHDEILKFLRQKLKEPKTSKRSVNLVDSSTMNPSGSGGQSFQDAISSLNAQDYKKAADFFKLAIEEGLDSLRMGYAYAHL
ncbi:MAG: ankyrin repeat domain-containing protein, partial [Candidatus Aminicenantes bacterium]|nr:ankyrin repeat domain-containing protein [Candidatus Aminicenantes bacterium]